MQGRRIMRHIALFVAVTALCLFSLNTGVAAAEKDVDLLEPVRLEKLTVNGFWKENVKRLTEKWIPHCIEQMEKGGRGQELLNLVNTAKVFAGESASNFTGAPWSDAYIYNTVESICLALAFDPAGDPALASAQKLLRKRLEEWIPIILAAQMDDGYIHSYHILNQRKRYTDESKHEFYVQGYFLEMGVAHYRMTQGKDLRLYNAARKCADHLCRTFGPPPKRMWVHGHAGMGYALCRLGRLVNDVEGAPKGNKYIELAKFLFDTRHNADYPGKRARPTPYNQSHKPVVEMEQAVGHAVRATYFYTAMADLASLTHDTRYLKAVDKIWENAIQRKHYITGGVGASHSGEAFAGDYELPNTGYCESCASCGMTFWADRMHRIHHKAHFHDVIERVLYNNLIGAIELTGTNFFYQNPLASDRGRYPWHGCPCCVGNIPRALLHLKDYLYTLNEKKNTLYINHFAACRTTIPEVNGAPLPIEQKTAYPWKGQVSITLLPEKPTAFTIKVRIPDLTESELYTAVPPAQKEYSLKINGTLANASTEDGYIVLKRNWQKKDTITLVLPLEIQRVYCDTRVQANRGRVALQRGPIVYTIENVDHEQDVRRFVLPPDAKLTSSWKEDLLGGIVAIECKDPKMLAVPNSVRLNRGGWSQVWILEDPEQALNANHPVNKELDKKTIDRVYIGDPGSEGTHHLKSERSASGMYRGFFWRHATNGGWFSYNLAVQANVKNVLVCTYWGDESGNRKFDLLADGEKIGSQVLLHNKPGSFFEVRYPLPVKMVKNKKSITITLKAENGATAGGVFDMRIIAETKE